MTDGVITSTHKTREDGIAQAIAEASTQAIEENEPVTIFACLGDACGRLPGGECLSCEIITCCPDGTVKRETRRN